MSKGVLLLVDLEGIIGVQNTSSDEHCRILLIDELSHVISTLHKHRFYQITVCNIHNDGKLLDNKDAALLNVRLIKGIASLASLDIQFDFAMLLGFHGMANSGGKFGHTFRYDFEKVCFDNQSLGEVGLYTRWLELCKVPVLLVSGEGDFKKELIPGGHQIHVIDASDGIDTTSRYEELNFMVEISIREKIREPHKILDGIVEIEVDNSDKYILLSKDPYKYCVLYQKFVFSSLNDFFVNLLFFCIALNNASDEILRKNLLLAKKIRQQGIQKTDIDLRVRNILNLPINKIDHSARLTIAKVMNIVNKDDYANST